MADAEISDLLQCDALKGQIGDFYSTEGAMIFSLNAGPVGFIAQQRGVEQMLCGLRPMIYAVPLEKISAASIIEA